MAKATTQAAQRSQSAQPTQSNPTTQGNNPTATATGGKKYSYETMIIGVGKGHKAIRNQLDELARRLGCKPSALVWEGINRVLATPPTQAPAGSQGSSVGSAAGFWVVPITDNTGRASRFEVVETDQRSSVSGGRTFFRYDRADAKNRTRARNQAIRAAQHDSTLIGAKPDTVKIKDMQGKAAAAA